MSPLRAVAGRAVTVSVSGDLCRGEDASVRVGISAHPSEDADEFVAQATFAPDADGDWAGELVLDADLAPGTYRVGTTCSLHLSSFLYESVDIVLTAGATPPSPPATPVAGQPRFTG